MALATGGWDFWSLTPHRETEQRPSRVYVVTGLEEHDRRCPRKIPAPYLVRLAGTAAHERDGRTHLPCPYGAIGFPHDAIRRLPEHDVGGGPVPRLSKRWIPKLLVDVVDGLRSSEADLGGV